MDRLIDIWHIQEMGEWDEDYFNMEVQAYIEIEKTLSGKFQFGLVAGYFHGKIKSVGGEQRLEFTWEGNDEMDEAFGAGWVKLNSLDEIEGEIRFHHGDDSTFKATRKK